MERRILGWVLSAVHVLLAAVAIGVACVVLFGAVSAVQLASGSTPVDPPRGWWLPIAVLLGGYWLVLGALGLRSVRAGLREAAAGDFAGASERLRRFGDREVLLRLVGMPGFVFTYARLAEAAAYWMHGMAGEAFSIAADLAERRTAAARSAAAIAAGSAAELGDPRAWSRLGPWIVRAERDLRPREHVSIVASLGNADVQALRLADAEKRAAALLGANASSRAGLVLRGVVRLVRGDLDAADGDLVAARASTEAPANPFATQLIDAVRIEIARARGDLAGARAISDALDAERPWHRHPLLAIAAVRALASKDAIRVLEDVAQRFSYDPLFGAAAGLALARAERAAGLAASASKRLAPALASVHLSIRQEALFEDAECRDALGDAAGARAAREACAAISRETRLGRAAAARLAGTVTEGGALA